MIERSFKLGGGVDVSVFYMSGVTDTEAVHEYVIKPLLSAILPEREKKISKTKNEPLANGADNGQEKQSGTISYILENVYKDITNFKIYYSSPD